MCLFSLDKGNKRNYLVTLAKEVTEEGTVLRPVFSQESSEAYNFESFDMAKKYFDFLEESSEFEYSFCILPETLPKAKKNTEEEKVVDSES